MKKANLVLAAGAFLLAPGLSAAAPIVSVDVEPSAAGVQSSRSVGPGASFDIDIVISGVEESMPLNGFQFDLLFDPAIVSAVSVVDGGFLLDPVFILQEEIDAFSVEFSEVTFGLVGAFGDGVLASISMTAEGLGTSLLDLTNVELTAPDGLPIPIGDVRDGFVAVVPEPSAALVFAVGLLLVGARLRARATA